MDATFLVFRELNKKLILHRTGSLEHGFGYHLVKNDGGKTRSIVLGANKNVTLGVDI